MLPPAISCAPAADASNGPAGSTDGEPRQRVTPIAPTLDVIQLPDEAAVLRELESDAARPFALDQAPLVRARLLALSLDALSYIQGLFKNNGLVSFKRHLGSSC